MSAIATRDRSPARSFVNPATVIVVCALALTFLGLAILFSASASFRNKQGIEVPYQYLSKQMIGVLVAGALCFAFSRLNLELIRREYVWWIGGACLFFLLLVAIPHVGTKVNGSRRWLGFGGGMSVQVSELAKLGFVFVLANYLSISHTRIGEFKRGVLVPLGITVPFAALIVLEPDFGMASFYILLGVTMVALAGAKWTHLMAAASVPVAGLVTLFIYNPNRLTRFIEFWRKEPPYQIKQALVAYAAGGVDGVGLGQGRQQLNYLPEAHTDMIFAVVGEELGLLFTLGIVVTFVVMLAAGLIHLRRAPIPFQFQLVSGCLLCIAIQTLVNLLSVTGMMPPKGMSLPFISAGLSNLLLMGMLIGVILNTQRTWGRAALPPPQVRLMKEVLV